MAYFIFINASPIIININTIIKYANKSIIAIDRFDDNDDPDEPGDHDDDEPGDDDDDDDEPGDASVVERVFPTVQASLASAQPDQISQIYDPNDTPQQIFQLPNISGYFQKEKSFFWTTLPFQWPM